MHERNGETFSPLAVFSLAQWRKYPSACSFITVVFLLYVYISLKLFAPDLRERAISQFHLTCPTFIEWAVNQPIPAMYNFANEIWIGSRPKNVTKEFPAGSRFKHYYTWVNHYPLRVITFSWYRSMILTDVDYKYISLRSAYRGTFLETCYYLNVKDGQVYMERVY